MASGEELQGRLTHIAVKVMELCDYCQRHSPGAILANNSSGGESPPRRITQRHGEGKAGATSATSLAWYAKNSMSHSFGCA